MLSETHEHIPNSFGQNTYRGVGTMTLNGGQAVPAGGEEISLWCNNGDIFTGELTSGQILFMQVGSFF